MSVAEGISRPYHGGTGGGVLVARHDYRRTIASLLPAAQSAYILIGFPLIYGSEKTRAPGAPPPEYFLNKLVFPALFLLGVALLLSQRRRIAWWRQAPIVFLAPFVCWSGLSFAWSLAPDVTTNKAILLVLALAAPLSAIAVGGSLERCLKAIFWVVSVAMAINLAAVLTMEPGPIGHEGIYSHKNLLGSYAALGVIFGLSGMLSRWSIYKCVGLFTLIASFLILMQSQSKTSLLLAVLVPALAFIMIVVRRQLAISLRVQAVALMAATLFAFHVLRSAYGFGIGMISNMISGEPTFTGRVELWTFSLDRIAERPWLGHGYQAFWSIGNASPSHHAVPGFIHVTPHAHNGYIDVALELGLVGLILLLLILLSSFGVVDRIARQNPRLAYVVLSICCLPIFHNLLESTWFSPMEAIMVSFLPIVFAAAIQRRERELNDEW